MKQVTGLVTGISKIFDVIAGLCLISIMLVVVLNILLRVFVGSPILGTYEYVGFLTASVIGLALAHCSVQKGHIAVTFLLDRFSTKLKTAADIFVNLLALFFFSLCVLYMVIYANTAMEIGRVSPTTQIPLSPFIYIIALGMFALCLVLLVGFINTLKKVAYNE